MLKANKSFMLRAGHEITRGETIGLELWASLPRRTQDALKGARFIVDTPDAIQTVSPEPVETPKTKRGK